MRWSSLASLLIPLLAIVAEGAWLTVAYLALQAGIAGQLPVFGPLELPLAVGLGMLLRRAGVIDPEERPLRFVAVLVLVGAAGWLVAGQARQALGSGELAAAVGQHPGGWLLLVALLRGAGRPDPAADDRGLTRLVLRGTPLLALPWILGQLALPEPRTAFIAPAYVASLTFVSAGLMAAGLARLQAIGNETGVDWRRERGWLGLIGAVIVGVVLLALPTALLLDVPASAVLLALLGPLTILAAIVFYVVVYPIAIAAGIVLDLLRALGFRVATPDPQQAPPLGEDPFGDPDMVELWFVALGLTWALLALTAFVIIRHWLRRRTVPVPRSEEVERAIVLPERLMRLPQVALRRRRRRRAPRANDGVTAYLAALEELDRADPTLARASTETPAAHARRLRAEGRGGLPLELLAADYQLVRYAEQSLSAVEHRRAVSRWRRIRDGLRTRRGD